MPFQGHSEAKPTFVVFVLYSIRYSSGVRDGVSLAAVSFSQLGLVVMAVTVAAVVLLLITTSAATNKGQNYLCIAGATWNVTLTSAHTTLLVLVLSFLLLPLVVIHKQEQKRRIAAAACYSSSSSSSSSNSGDSASVAGHL